jgi:hypothetical protein
MTEQEKKVMDLLVKAHNEFIKLDSQHPNELPDWLFHLHALQRIIGFRATQRNYPEHFAVISERNFMLIQADEPVNIPTSKQDLDIMRRL